MSVIGLITAFNEAPTIVTAIDSLWEAGCDRVVVVDGAWKNPDGTPFGGDGWASTDNTVELALAAGAQVQEAYQYDDGGKRDAALRLCGSQNGDHLLLLDADEAVAGRIGEAPWGHGVVTLRNDKPNDLPGRTPWLDADVRESVPMLRWLRWNPTLRCQGPGRYTDGGYPIHAYLIEALAAKGNQLEPLHNAALAALRSVEHHLPDYRLAYLAFVEGITISHYAEASPEKVAAKARYYAIEQVAA